MTLKPIIGPGYNPKTGQIEENASERVHPIKAGGWFVGQMRKAYQDLYATENRNTQRGEEGIAKTPETGN